MKSLFVFLTLWSFPVFSLYQTMGVTSLKEQNQIFRDISIRGIQGSANSWSFDCVTLPDSGFLYPSYFPKFHGMKQNIQLQTQGVSSVGGVVDIIPQPLSNVKQVSLAPSVGYSSNTSGLSGAFQTSVNTKSSSFHLNSYATALRDGDGQEHWADLIYRYNPKLAFSLSGFLGEMSSNNEHSQGMNLFKIASALKSGENSSSEFFGHIARSQGDLNISAYRLTSTQTEVSLHSTLMPYQTEYQRLRFFASVNNISTTYNNHSTEWFASDDELELIGQVGATFEYQKLFSLTGALAYQNMGMQNLDKSFSGITPTVGLSYHLMPNIFELFGNYNEGVLLPKSYQLYSNGEIETIGGIVQTIADNPNLKKSSSRQIEIGFLSKFKNYEFRYTEFVNKIKKFIYLQKTQIDATHQTLMFANDYDFKTYGNELELGARFSQIYLYTQYERIAGEDLTIKQKLPFLGPDKISLGTEIEFFDRSFKFSSKLSRLLKRNVASNNRYQIESTPATWLSDLELVYSPKGIFSGVESKLSLTNFLDQKVRVHTDTESLTQSEYKIELSYLF